MPTSLEPLPVAIAATPALPPPPVSAPPTVLEPDPEPSIVATEYTLEKTPSKVEIEFQIMRKGGVAGHEHQSFQTTSDGLYVLTSQAGANGLLSLVLSDLMQKSEGQITKQGLRPNRFLYQYGKNAGKAQKAEFDWQNNVLTLEVGNQRRTVELEAGSQDLMSFMYQFMFVPPLQQMQLSVSNGKMLRTYNYIFAGEETLPSKMGPLRTWHISKSSGTDEEKADLWLAVDYHYLPVKISKAEKDGTLMERIATSLQLEYPP